MLYNWLVLIAGIYFVFFGTTAHTTSFFGAVFYRFFPTILGLACVIAALHFFGLF